MLNRVLLAMQNSMLLEGATDGAYNAARSVLDEVLKWLELLLVPIFSIACIVGIIYVIVIVVKMARADNAEQREEAKKKVIYTVVGVLIGVVMIILLILLKNNLGNWIFGELNNTPTQQFIGLL